MENKEKYLRTNKRLTIGIIVFSILSIVMLIGNKSYALFQATVKTDKPVVTINTSSEFASMGPKISGLAKYILDKAYSNTSELVAIDVTDKSNIKKCASLAACEGKEVEYRYIGRNVNNYVYLKSDTEVNEKWRIIGLFLNDKGTEWTIKVVRDEVLPESYLPESYVMNNVTLNGSVQNVTYTIKEKTTNAYYNKNNIELSSFTKNRWEQAGLQYYLNIDHDDSSSSERGYLSRLSTETKNLLVKKTYYLGTIHTYSVDFDTPKVAYKHERDVEGCTDGKGSLGINNHTAFQYEDWGCHVYEGNASTWQGKVGLMYPSDYGLSTTEENWDTTFYDEDGEKSFEDTSVNGTSWMYNTMGGAQSNWSWFISPSSVGITQTVYWNSSGYIYNDTSDANYPLLATFPKDVHPVLYLSYKTPRLLGAGTSSSPYQIIPDKNKE